MPIDDLKAALSRLRDTLGSVEPDPERRDWRGAADDMAAVRSAVGACEEAVDAALPELSAEHADAIRSVYADRPTAVGALLYVAGEPDGREVLRRAQGLSEAPLRRAAVDETADFAKLNHAWWLMDQGEAR